MLRVTEPLEQHHLRGHDLRAVLPGFTGAIVAAGLVDILMLSKMVGMARLMG